ncbi:hypothetical protein JVT61DRAFT_1845 [Boletus reticuloceps]|uniref:Uncharacterized protein n=1 Tax=Boletus reticuloceps TaxID=495285 RepID=A0A8I2YPZ4_9AGAM|nr:hypothetical protein JVT61DRAFT_9724 [Boletus reticuloceps]KAG6376819.1 hypothetical protein JVT61DRAFT_1845 [Boletus reticuloceps]
MSETSNNNPAQTEHHLHIQPHPAVSDVQHSRLLAVTNAYAQKSNNPADLVDGGAGLMDNPAMMAHHAREPHVLSQEMMNKLDAPLSREELKKRSEELNK